MPLPEVASIVLCCTRGDTATMHYSYSVWCVNVKERSTGLLWHEPGTRVTLMSLVIMGDSVSSPATMWHAILQRLGSDSLHVMISHHYRCSDKSPPPSLKTQRALLPMKEERCLQWRLIKSADMQRTSLSCQVKFHSLLEVIHICIASVCTWSATVTDKLMMS